MGHDEEPCGYEHKRMPGVAWDMVTYTTYGNSARSDDGWGVFVMVGDDRERSFPMSDMLILLPEEFCGQCGQVGCTGDRVEQPVV